MDTYRRYGPALLRKCERMLGNRPDAEDVVQTLFIDLYRKGRADVDLPYLYRAATTRCLNRIRDSRRQRELLAQHGDVLLCSGPGLPEARTVTVDLLRQLVGGLDERSSEILVFRYLDQMTGDEIADLLGISRRAVTKRLERIRLALEALAQHGGEA
ncbi:MAG: sigma-70 family RNA polymerase sigma factor [Pseudomonadota bacterium]